MALPTPGNDFVGLADFHEALADYAPEAERLIESLRQQPEDPKRVADLFRLLHNIKGDATLCRVQWAVPVMHAVESLLERVRSGKQPFGDGMRQLLLLALDRIVEATELAVDRQPVDPAPFDALTVGLGRLQQTDISRFETEAQQLVVALIHGAEGDQPGPAHDPDGDLAFFRSLALQLEQHAPTLVGRTQRNLTLALAANEAAGNPVDPAQLSAAVYMHDIGMMLLPEHLWLTTDALPERERMRLHQHPGWAAGLIGRMPGWQDAARMVAQHHERANGSGYPQGLQQGEICQGAGILALVDTFEAVMVKHAHRSLSSAMLRAATEVNASAQQFDPALLPHFNLAVRALADEARGDR
ncbi:HD-GYP domain-containing protein [Chitinolyticbacter meiyuanensis]|uniref:HD-GYP domain-containing protein n=1 Tax=Chitinolyticbacter meiyuanensis TaxID=682798 RepID=UPI0011E5D0B4|nr:HD domain-containing phosphohydrolase [Chitinolyticbacter meiyuanensis]